MNLNATVDTARIQTRQRNAGIDRAAGTDYPMLGGWLKTQYIGTYEACQAINEARSLRVPDFDPDASADAPAPGAESADHHHRQHCRRSRSRSHRRAHPGLVVMKLPSLSPEWVAEHRAKGMTGAQMAECLAEYRRGFALALTDYRQRCKAIVKSPEAKGREDMALHLALETDMTADAAIGTLAAIPRAVDTSRLNRLGLAIAASGGSPNVGSEFDAPGEACESADAVAKRITSY